MIIRLFLLAIKVSEEVVVEPSRSVVEAQFLIDAINPLQIGGLELEVATEVGSNTRWCLGLWNNRVAVVDAPRQCYLRTCLVVLLANLDKCWIVLR